MYLCYIKNYRQPVNARIIITEMQCKKGELCKRNYSKMHGATKCWVCVQWIEKRATAVGRLTEMKSPYMLPTCRHCESKHFRFEGMDCMGDLGNTKRWGRVDPPNLCGRLRATQRGSRRTRRSGGGRIRKRRRRGIRGRGVLPDFGGSAGMRRFCWSRGAFG